MRVGVLAVQGAVREHRNLLTSLGVETLAVRRPSELEQCDALVLPGGESTTMIKLLDIFELTDPLKDQIAAGLPVLGTCAGMILLADRILDGTSDQTTIGGLDVTVRRNAFGRQVDSFEEDIDFKGLSDPVHAVFIRAPWIEEAGPGVEILARAAGRIVAVREGRRMATSFHPEVGSDGRIHQLFLEMSKKS